MVPESMVVEDGVDEARPHRRPTSPWLLVSVGFGLGLALGTLVSPNSESPAATVTTLQESVSTALQSVEARGIASAVPGFPNGLVAVANSADGGREHLVWPVGEGLRVGGMAGGSAVSLDSTGQFIALTEEVPGLDGRLLSMGRFTLIRPVLSGVTSYSWHDSRSGELAFTTEEDGGWRLYRASRTLIPHLVVEDLYVGATIAGWGDWGYAIQTVDGQVALLNGDGGFKDLESGRAIGSHESGWIIVEDADIKLVSAGGGVRRLFTTDERHRPIARAALSPDGSRIAMAGRFGVSVFDIEDEELVDLSPVYPSDWVIWSSDSRFVVSPALNGVYIHDLRTGDTYDVLTDHSVEAAAVLPLAAS